jgi:hypothetical protein
MKAVCLPAFCLLPFPTPLPWKSTLPLPMPSPLPGMDPFLEAPELWPEVYSWLDAIPKFTLPLKPHCHSGSRYSQNFTQSHLRPSRIPYLHSIQYFNPTRLIPRNPAVAPVRPNSPEPLNQPDLKPFPHSSTPHLPTPRPSSANTDALTCYRS